MLQALTHLSEFRGESSFKTWIWRIGVRHILRKKRGLREQAAKVAAELEVLTDQGIKIPDVLWLNPNRSSGHIQKPITPAPDICVEVCSPTNKIEDLVGKRACLSSIG